MKENLFEKLSTIMEACKDENGKTLAIPLLKEIRIINNELFASVDKFCDQFGIEVDSETTRLITEKFNSQVN